MNGIEADVVLFLAASLLTYLIYSSAAMATVWLVCRVGRWQHVDLKVRLWKGAVLLPVPLVFVAMFVPVPWLPTMPLQAWTTTVPQTSVSNAQPVVIASPRQTDRGRLAEAKLSVAVSEISDHVPLRNIGGRRRSLVAQPLPFQSRATLMTAGVLIWLVVAGMGLVRLVRDCLKLSRLMRSAEAVADPDLHAQLAELAARMELSRSVDLVQSSQVNSPIAVGIRRPCIVLPSDWIGNLNPQCQEAVLAHELGHVSRHDPAWNLVSQCLLRVFWLQPLNRLAVKELRRQMEYAADQQAAGSIDSPVSLAQSLVMLAECFKQQNRQRSWSALPAGMSASAGVLKGRVSALLTQAPTRSGRRVDVASCSLLGLLCLVSLVAIPRVATRNSSLTSLDGESPMRSVWKKVGLMTGIVVGGSLASMQNVPADEIPTTLTAEESVAGLPEGLQRFSGMLIGKMVKRDIERGRFTVQVQYVARVWENNKASRPRDVVGKAVTVNGISGKWLDELLLVRPGETVEFEAQHRDGNELTFPGEWLKKVPAFDPAEHPVPVDGMRGFAGLVTGKVIKKNPTSRELHLQIDGIEKTFERNRAKSPEDTVGKKIVLAGFWARMSKPFETIEAGDRIRAGVLHRVPQSDHFTVIEMAKPIEQSAPSTSLPATSSKEDATGFPAGMKGFRGILVGRLESKDVEAGTLVFTATEVKRTWKANRASNPNSSKGKPFLVKGISGKWVDVLITLKKGDTIEVEAFHNSGEHLDFIAEWLKKVE